MLRTVVSVVLAVVAVVGPANVASIINAVVSRGGDDGKPRVVESEDLTEVAAVVAALPPQSRSVWESMFSACAASLRADSSAEPAVLRSLESMRRFHAAVGRFAWRTVGGNEKNPALVAALEKLFASRFGDADRLLTADDRERLAVTYDSLAALAR